MPRHCEERQHETIQRGNAYSLRCPGWRSLPTGLLRFARNDQKEKGSGTPTDVCINLRALRARRAPAGALAYRRSTTALTVRAFGPWAQLQARLPGTWQDVRSCKLAPTGEQRTSRSYTGVTRARLSQSRERTSRTGRSAGQMMPEAARVRSVSFRARVPHSLHPPEYLRDRRPWRARFFERVLEMGTDVNEKATSGHPRERAPAGRDRPTKTCRPHKDSCNVPGQSADIVRPANLPPNICV